jgi:hypothetical protein
MRPVVKTIDEEKIINLSELEYANLTILTWRDYSLMLVFLFLFIFLYYIAWYFKQFIVKLIYEKI